MELEVCGEFEGVKINISGSIIVTSDAAVAVEDICVGVRVMNARIILVRLSYSVVRHMLLRTLDSEGDRGADFYCTVSGAADVL